MTDFRLRRHCEQVVSGLGLSQPFDVPDLCRLVGQRRGRPIHLLPMSLPAASPCGMWVHTGAFDAIFYQRDTSPLHQLLIIGHELGHLLAGHQTAEVLDPQASRLLLPDLDPNLVQRFLGRGSYSATEEREAEMIGSLLLARANPSTPVSRWVAPPEVADGFGRLEHLLTHQRRDRRG